MSSPNPYLHNLNTDDIELQLKLETEKNFEAAKEITNLKTRLNNFIQLNNEQDELIRTLREKIAELRKNREGSF